VLTFDLSQQSYSIYYKNKNWYYHLNFGRMGIALNRGASVTKTWDLKKFTFGAQLGTSIISNNQGCITSSLPVARVGLTPYYIQSPLYYATGIEPLTVCEIVSC
jgi:hypothetical protein